MSALPKGIAATSGGGDWLEFVLRVPADDPDFCIHFALSARNDKLWFARIATLLLMHRDSWCDRSMRTHALPAAAHTRVPCHSPLAGSSRMGYTLGQIIFGEDAGTDERVKRGMHDLLFAGGARGGHLPPWVDKTYSEIKSALRNRSLRPQDRVRLLVFESCVMIKRQRADARLVREAILGHVAQQGAMLERYFKEMHAVSGAGDTGLRRALATLVLDQHGRLRRAESGVQLFARVPTEKRLREAGHPLVRLEGTPQMFEIAEGGTSEQLRLSPRPIVPVGSLPSPQPARKVVTAWRGGRQQVIQSILPGSLPWPAAPEHDVCHAAGLDMALAALWSLPQAELARLISLVPGIPHNALPPAAVDALLLSLVQSERVEAKGEAPGSAVRCILAAVGVRTVRTLLSEPPPAVGNDWQLQEAQLPAGGGVSRWRRLSTTPTVAQAALVLLAAVHREGFTAVQALAIDDDRAAERKDRVSRAAAVALVQTAAAVPSALLGPIGSLWGGAWRRLLKVVELWATCEADSPAGLGLLLVECSALKGALVMAVSSSAHDLTRSAVKSGDVIVGLAQGGQPSPKAAGHLFASESHAGRVQLSLARTAVLPVHPPDVEGVGVDLQVEGSVAVTAVAVAQSLPPSPMAAQSSPAVCVMWQAVARQVLERWALRPEDSDGATRCLYPCCCWVCGQPDGVAAPINGSQPAKPCTVAATVTVSSGGGIVLKLRARKTPPPPPRGFVSAFAELGVPEAEYVPDVRQRCLFGCGRYHRCVRLPTRGAAGIGVRRMSDIRQTLSEEPVRLRKDSLGFFMNVRSVIFWQLRQEQSKGNFTEHAHARRLESQPPLPLVLGIDADGAPAGGGRSVLNIGGMLADDVRGRPLAERLFENGRSRFFSFSKSWLSEEEIWRLDEVLTYQLAEACAEPYCLGNGLRVAVRLGANISDHKMLHIMSSIAGGTNPYRDVGWLLDVNGWRLARGPTFSRSILDIAAAVRVQQAWRKAALEKHRAAHGGAEPDEASVNRQAKVLFGGLSEAGLGGRAPCLTTHAGAAGLALQYLRPIVKVLHDMEKAISERIHWVLYDLAGDAIESHSNGEVERMKPNSKTAGRALIDAARKKELGKLTMDDMLGKHWGQLIEGWTRVYKPHVPSSAVQMAALHQITLHLAYTPVLPTVGCWKVMSYTLLCTQHLFLKHRLQLNPDLAKSDHSLKELHWHTVINCLAAEHRDLGLTSPCALTGRVNPRPAPLKYIDAPSLCRVFLPSTRAI